MLLVDSSVWIDYFATYAIAHSHELLHADGDFDPFEAHRGLRVVHP